MEDQNQMPDDRFAIYVRSSPDAEGKATDVDAQIAAARAYGETLRLRLNFQCIFIDIGSTAAKRRPGLEAVLRTAQVKTPPFGAIVVDGYDRLFRDAIALAHFVQSLDKLGISVVSAKGSAVDLSASPGNLVSSLEEITSVLNAVPSRTAIGRTVGGRKK